MQAKELDTIGRMQETKSPSAMLCPDANEHPRGEDACSHCGTRMRFGESLQGRLGDINYPEGERQIKTLFWAEGGKDGQHSPHAGLPKGADTCSFVAPITRAATTARGSTGSSRTFPAVPRKVDPGTQLVSKEIWPDQYQAKLNWAQVTPEGIFAYFQEGSDCNMVGQILVSSSCGPTPLGRSSGNLPSFVQ